MSPYQSQVVVAVLLEACLASLPHRYIQKLLHHPEGSRRVQILLVILLNQDI